MAWEYYEFLGIAPDASEDVIKRSCFRKRKELTIADDEKGLEHLNEVSQTLQDAQARAEYDAMQQHGEEISRLRNDALQAMESGYWSTAIQSLKRLIILLPNQPIAYNQLGICYAEAWMFSDAKATFTKLLELSPNIAQYWADYAQALLKLSSFAPNTLPYGGIITSCPHCKSLNSLRTGKGFAETTCSVCSQPFFILTDGTKDQLVELARTMLQEAIRLEEENTSYYFAIANTYADVEDFTQAEQWIERVIGRNGKEDMHDLDAFFFLCQIHCRSRQLHKFSATVQRIHRVLPDEADAREYVGHRFAHWAYQMYQLDSFDIAVALVDTALAFLPQEEKIIELANTLKRCHAAYREYTAFTNDKKIPQAQKSVIAFFLLITTVSDIDDYLQQPNDAGVQNDDQQKRYVDPRVKPVVNSAVQISSLSTLSGQYDKNRILTMLAQWLKAQSAAKMQPTLTTLQLQYANLSELTNPLLQEVVVMIPKV